MQRLAESVVSTLAAESPTHAALLANRLGALKVRVQVGEETFTVLQQERRTSIRSELAYADVRVRTSVQCLLDLVGGRKSLASALADELLVIHGALSQLQIAGDSFHILIHGLVRAPSGPRLLQRLEHLNENQHD